ncbi:hypothetical protein [Streptomyces hirsutus]|uniref:hypothetical protein n=1 Tax=Streptomyces hirsutus TaxID=35620 RepID=UPI0012FEEC77|nr:hypothetical protein [Streptomyces hirsutus]
MDLDELVEHWTLLKDEQELVSGKRGATRLGFPVLLKFYTQHGRFPRSRAEHVACKERRAEQVRGSCCRAESIEPPTPGRCERIAAGALQAAEESLTVRISSRLTAESIERLVALVAAMRRIGASGLLCNFHSEPGPWLRPVAVDGTVPIGTPTQRT